MENSERLYWDAEIYRETDCFEKALPLYERVLEMEPEFYQASRGKAMVLRQLGRREEALIFARRSIEINPNYADGWGAVGTILQESGQGDEAVACYRRGLQNAPSDIALLRSLARTFPPLGFPGGDEGTVLRKIESCKLETFGVAVQIHNEYRSSADLGKLVRALSLYKSVVDLFEGTAEAKIQNNLGRAYSDLPHGDRGENLRRATACHEAALRGFTEVAFPVDWASTQIKLGYAYLEYPCRDHDKNLQRAIACYEAALRVCTEARFPAEWAKTQNNLGIAYNGLQGGDRLDNLRRAIGHYQAALRVRSEAEFPWEWARTQRNLGAAYNDLPLDANGENLKRAIGAYESTLRIFTETNYPVDWAMTHSNLGTAYNHLPFGDPGDNLTHAIACHEAALRVFTATDFPFEWATTQNNLGAVYQDLPRGDRPDNLLRAIACHEAALTVLTDSEFPVQWMNTQINLGAAYSRLPGGNSMYNTRRAISCLEAALRVATETDFPEIWAATLNTLGFAYRNQPDGLERAVTCFEAALRVCTESNYPAEWAGIQTNIGSAYCLLKSGDRLENLRRAIGCYEAALRVTTEAQFPISWAMTQSNLGNAYKFVFEDFGKHREDLTSAVACFQAALRVYTPDHFPRDCNRVLNSLGDLHFQQEDYGRALPILVKTIKVMESIRLEALDDVEKRRIFSSSDSEVIFHEALSSAVQTQNYVIALTLIEQGKTRNLTDHLWRSDQKPANVSIEEWNSYQGCLARLHQTEQQMGSGTERQDLHPKPNVPRSVGERADYAAILTGIAQVRSDIRGMENGFAEQDPDYTPFAKPLGLSEILALARESEAVIVDFRVTESGTYVFLAGPSDSDITGEQVIKLPDLNNVALFQFVSEWFITHYTGKEWMTSLAEPCGRLYQLVFQSVHARLRERYPDLKRLILIPSRGLALLPLHAAQWESEGTTKYLLDEYEISYSPSCHVLQRCLLRQRNNPAVAASLLAVQNPDGSLPFSDWEVEETAQHFPAESRIILRGAEATDDRVRESLEFGEEKLFSCHGHWDVREVQNSYLALHGQDRLSLSDIVPASLRGTRLVMLSACESGLSDVFDGQDEYNGLPAAFLLGGAQTVVSTMFSVGDLPTALLSQRFHENLYLRNMAKAPALREAQLWLRDLSIDEADARLKSKQHELTAGTQTRVQDQWERIAQRMSVHDSVAARFDLRKGGAHPFANPVHWAAFYCVGAGW